MATIVEARGTIETVARDLVLGTFCNIRLLCTNIIREKNFEGIKNMKNSTTRSKLLFIFVLLLFNVKL